MNATEFRRHTQEALKSLPEDIKDKNIPLAKRKLGALIHLNSSIYPALKNNTQMHLDILRMNDGPEKLQSGILWSLAVAQNSPDEMRAIMKSMDDYLESAMS
jgi:hypothetical protein